MSTEVEEVVEKVVAEVVEELVEEGTDDEHGGIFSGTFFFVCSNDTRATPNMVRVRPRKRENVTGSFRPTKPMMAAKKGFVTSTTMTRRAPIMDIACNQQESPIVIPMNAESRIHPTSAAAASFWRKDWPDERFRTPMKMRNTVVARSPLKVLRKRLLPFHMPSQM